MSNVRNDNTDKTVFLYNEVNGKWSQIDYLYLRNGDLFCMFEADGSPVKNNKDGFSFRAIGEIEYGEFGTPYIESEDGEL